MTINQLPQADDLEAFEQCRLDALESLDVLDTPHEQEFERIVRLVRATLGVRIATVTFLDGHRQWHKAFEGLEKPESSRRDSFCRYTIDAGKPLVVNDTLLDARFAQNANVTGSPYLRFYAGVPLTTREGFHVGTVCAMDTQPRDLSDAELAILKDLADIVIRELELRQQSSIDGLTGAMNRRAFREDGQRAIDLARRHKKPVSCIVLDLDHFKAVNDTYGHAAGDELLTAVSAACQNLLRSSDRFGRLGGEEFGVLLPHADAPGALGVAEKLRAAVAATPFHGNGMLRNVTASFGVASSTSAITQIEQLIAEADQALYVAKGGGRNRCVLASSSASAETDRRRVLKGGTILVNRSSTFDCTVRWLSGSGAGLEVSDTYGVADRFELTIPSEAMVERDCRVLHRTKKHLEVEFR